jgi:hypothetical protein
MLEALQGGGLRSTLEPLEFLVEVTEPDKPLLVTRTQHEQILVYIALGEREKAIEAIEQGRQAAHVYLGQMALPIPSDRTEHQEFERQQLIARLEKLLAMLRRNTE